MDASAPVGSSGTNPVGFFVTDSVTPGLYGFLAMFAKYGSNTGITTPVWSGIQPSAIFIDLF